MCATLSKSVECTIAERLLLKVCGIEYILVSEIRPTFLNDLVITEVIKLFYYKDTTIILTETFSCFFS